LVTIGTSIKRSPNKTSRIIRIEFFLPRRRNPVRAQRKKHDVGPVPKLETSTYLAALPAGHIEVGYGKLGRNGDLGYEGKTVTVAGRRYANALSTHAPARLVYRLDGRFTRFRCQVAFNDDVRPNASHCSFSVLADRRQVCSTHMTAGDPPRELAAGIAGAQELELLVSTSRWEYCHSVWLDPVVDNEAFAGGTERIIDCLGRAEIAVPAVRPRARRCIATLASDDFSAMLDDLLGSLQANGGCHDALIVVFSLGDGSICRRIAAKYGATLISCSVKAKLGVSVKALLYSIARVIDADAFLCVDADMIVLGDLRPIFDALEACAPDSILAVREGNNRGFRDIEHVLTTAYGGKTSDLARLDCSRNREGTYPLVVNDGLFAGTRGALLALDDTIRRMPFAVAWMEERRDITYRNQFLFNLALAKLGCGVELDPIYNVQLHVQDAELRWSGARLEACWNGRRARILHFSGAGRRKYPEWRNLFGHVANPLTGAGDGDSYAEFLIALRHWTGRHGVDALSWSFYGAADAKHARVRDPSVFPLLATLHYLVRANGCIRVLETGTARGVSAACLATAVVARTGGRVVTFDPAPRAERLELWNTLPEAVGACIEQRITGSLEGMAAALAAGERYEAALLDSIHSEAHVWAEFQLAAQLVCPGGLILIHDVRYVHGTVEQALKRIEAAGYGVVRLWTAALGIAEDDGLGLAVIENRFREGERTQTVADR
jgi:predicted O-methyltransferase YrrM